MYLIIIIIIFDNNMDVNRRKSVLNELLIENKKVIISENEIANHSKLLLTVKI